MKRSHSRRDSRFQRLNKEPSRHHRHLRTSDSPSLEKENENMRYSKSREASRSPPLKEKKRYDVNRLREESCLTTSEITNTTYQHHSPASRFSRSPSFPINQKEFSPRRSGKVIRETVCLSDEHECDMQLTNLESSVVEKELDKLLNESEVYYRNT